MILIEHFSFLCEFANVLTMIMIRCCTYALVPIAVLAHMDNIYCLFSFSLFQEDLLIHGDSVYDIIDKQDHGSIQAELGRSVPQQAAGHHHHPHHHHHSHLNHHHATHLDGERRMFLCRMNVSRNARRQMRFGDQKVRFLCLLLLTCFFSFLVVVVL